MASFVLVQASSACMAPEEPFAYESHKYLSLGSAHMNYRGKPGNTVIRQAPEESDPVNALLSLLLTRSQTRKTQWALEDFIFSPAATDTITGLGQRIFIIVLGILAWLEAHLEALNNPVAFRYGDAALDIGEVELFLP